MLPLRTDSGPALATRTGSPQINADCRESRAQSSSSHAAPASFASGSSFTEARVRDHVCGYARPLRPDAVRTARPCGFRRARRSAARRGRERPRDESIDARRRPWRSGDGSRQARRRPSGNGNYRSVRIHSRIRMTARRIRMNTRTSPGIDRAYCRAHDKHTIGNYGHGGSCNHNLRCNTRRRRSGIEIRRLFLPHRYSRANYGCERDQRHSGDSRHACAPKPADGRRARRFLEKRGRRASPTDEPRLPGIGYGGSRILQSPPRTRR
jgi:hypothetical protein